MVTHSELVQSGWHFPPDFVNGLSEYEQSFVAFEFLPPRTFQYYLDRLTYLGFVDLESVLDAGCGMGQWSIALTERSSNVQGIDIDARRVQIAQTLAQQMGRAHRCQFQVGRLEALPYRDGSFDAVFCYGVFMFTDMPSTLREFHRVLRPGGRFYLNANTWGWYAHLLVDVPWNRRPAFRYLLNTALGRTRNAVVTERWLSHQLAAADLRQIAIGVEGSTTFVPGKFCSKPAPGYPEKYYGMRAVIEAIGYKNVPMAR